MPTDLPEYSKHPEFSHWVLRSRSNLCCLCHGGVINYINPVGIRLLNGQGPEDFIGHHLEEFVDPVYREMIDMGLDIFLEEESGVPLRLLTKQNIHIDAVMNVSQLKTAETEGDIYLVECNDITQLLQASEAARRREHKTAGILRSISDGVVTIDEMGAIQSMNAAAERMFGHEIKDVFNKNVSLLMPEPYRSEHDGYLADYKKRGTSDVFDRLREFNAIRKNGTEFPVEITTSVLVQEDGSRIFTAIVRDITERKMRDDKIAFLAHHDALTELPNRTLFEERLHRAIARAKRQDGTVALLYIDLDKFKPINDTFGHEAGDIVLKTVAERLVERVRANDTVARIGGDEFVVILEAINVPEDASAVAKSMIESLIEPIDEAAPGCAVGASIGISVWPNDATTIGQLMRCADRAMYTVKNTGRNNFLYYTPDMADDDEAEETHPN